MVLAGTGRAGAGAYGGPPSGSILVVAKAAGAVADASRPQATAVSTAASRRRRTPAVRDAVGGGVACG
jgi:hypothetical protein